MVPKNFLNLLTFAGIYGLSAIGLNVHFGWTGLLNFGHASFMGVGAYVTLLLMPHAAGREGEVTTTGLPFFAALINRHYGCCFIWIITWPSSYKITW